jgi:hypothetical protein
MHTGIRCPAGPGMAPGLPEMGWGMAFTSIMLNKITRCRGLVSGKTRNLGNWGMRVIPANILRYAQCE